LRENAKEWTTTSFIHFLICYHVLMQRVQMKNHHVLTVFFLTRNEFALNVDMA
jgi:hypothetical protein